MRKSFLYLLMSAMVLIGMGTLNSCKDYEDDIMGQFRVDQAIQDATLRDLLQNCSDECNRRIDSLRDVVDTCKKHCRDEQIRLNARIDSLRDVVDTLNKQDIKNLYDSCKVYRDSITNFYKYFVDLRDSITNHRSHNLV